VFSDEFDYSGAPNATKWLQQQGGHGWGNNELQFYTDKNAYVGNGVLTIETRKENFGNRSYTSTRLLSKTAFKYGIFEMRAKLPQGRGSWPAFWLLNNTKWPDSGEIDILEHVGYDPGVIHANIHCKKYNHVNGINKGDSIRISNPFNEWYTYKLDWNAERMIFYVDNIQFFVYSNTEKTYEAWPFDLSETIIINTAVGGTWGGAQGVDDSIFPIKFVTYLKYVPWKSKTN
jgi:beta-glucanase (GH16 family)